MKSTTTMGFVRWIGLAGFVVAFSALGSLSMLAQDHNSVSFGHADQQSSPSASTPELPVITPELRADILAVHGQYQAAIDAYNRIRPLTAEIYNKIGIAYQRLAMDQQAIASYAQASRMDNKFAAVYNNLGTIYFRENDNKRAQRLYKKSIRLDAQMAPFWSNLGAVYLSEKRYSDGAEAYERAFNLDPDIFEELALNGVHKDESPEDLANMYVCFAEIYAHAGMKTEAIAYLQKALQASALNRKKLQQDQQLASLHGIPAFDQLMSGESQP